MSTSWGGYAHYSVDGNRDAYFHNKSCSLARHGDPAWWIVDLQSEYEITHVVITNNDGTLVFINNPKNTTKKFWFGHLFLCAPHTVVDSEFS